MDVHEALRTRRTIHRYLPEPVAEAAIERALEAALLAPNHKHTWPWRFTLVGPETRIGLAGVGARLALAKTPPATPEILARVRAKLLDPSHLIVVSQVRTDDAFRAQEDYAAIACAIQNLSLSLHAEGIGSKWSSGSVTRDEETYRLLGIDPAVETIAAFVWAGRAANEPPQPKRPPLADVVRRLP